MITDLLGIGLFAILGKVGDESLLFITEKGHIYKMWHSQDCCEGVSLEDVCGDLNDLLGYPIVKAEEVTNKDNPKDKYDESCTWTFYHLSTVKGSVTIRWYGSSNGYYSEEISFKRINDDE